MKLKARMRTVGLWDSWNSPSLDLAEVDSAKKAGFALMILLTLSGFFLIAALSGCVSSVEKYNKELARQEYSKAHDECWKLFSRIDPERNREYRNCMKKKGWRIPS